MTKLDFFAVAKEISKAATCPRASVGAVLVKDDRIIATGYNGAPEGEPHCEDKGCIIHDNHCTQAVHAEMNAIGQCAKFGIAAEGAEMFVYSSRPRRRSATSATRV